MEFGRYDFGSIEIDGTRYEHDVVIDGGTVRKRKKGPSKPQRARYGHTPLSLAEEIPWECRRLVVGSGANGALPVVEEVTEEAARRRVQLEVIPTAQAIERLREGGSGTNAILHVTC
ncbi:MAG: MTH938/NDUFAF3 family protein [Actinomycetota bacterium]